MLTVVFHSEKGRCTGFDAAGHAKYAPPGEDIVCAAASALTLGTILALDRLTGTEIIQEQGNGKLVCRIRNPDDKTQLLLASLELSLCELQTEYGNHIEVCHG